MTTPTTPTLLTLLALLLSFPPPAARADVEGEAEEEPALEELDQRVEHQDNSERIAEEFKKLRYRCTDTPDRLGLFCVGGSPRTYVTIPRGLGRIEKLVFYAHGLVGVCGNGASGERYLKHDSATLLRARAIAVMPWRQSAGDAGFPLARYIRSYDAILARVDGRAERPLLLAGHSAAGPFFAWELIGNGKAILPRVEKVLVLDGVYGDQAARWNQVFASHPDMILHLVSTSTASRATNLKARIRQANRSRVILENLRGGHCDVPKMYFNKLVR